jgi:hypothetical protein
VGLPPFGRIAMTLSLAIARTTPWNENSLGSRCPGRALFTSHTWTTSVAGTALPFARRFAESGSCVGK